VISSLAIFSSGNREVIAQFDWIAGEGCGNLSRHYRPFFYLVDAGRRDGGAIFTGDVVDPLADSGAPNYVPPFVADRGLVAESGKHGIHILCVGSVEVVHDRVARSRDIGGILASLTVLGAARNVRHLLAMAATGKLEDVMPDMGGVEGALGMLEGRWKMVILFQLFAHPLLRFSELERAYRDARGRPIQPVPLVNVRSTSASCTPYIASQPKGQERFSWP